MKKERKATEWMQKIKNTRKVGKRKEPREEGKGSKQKKIST